MRCKQIRPRLGAYADGELPDHLRKGIEGHLAGCGRCGEELAALRALAALLGGLSAPPAPAGLESSILDAALRLPHRAKGLSRLWSAALRVAAALLVALAGVYLGVRSSRLPSAPSEVAQIPAGASVENLYEQSFTLLPTDSPGALVLSLYEEEGR